jgi:hypothetical protein
MRARFLVFNIEQINATAKHKIATQRTLAARFPSAFFSFVRAFHGAKTPSPRARSGGRPSSTRPPLAYFFLPPLAAFAARAASSAAMASCATFG